MTPAAARQGWAETILVFLLSLAFLLWMSDWVFFDGDDLNTVLPTLHLPQALEGDLLLYRYGWQPLSYWISYGVYALTGWMGAIFALVQIAMAAGIAMLYRAVCAHVGLSRMLFLPLVLLFPELIYNGFYFNAHAVGFPFAVLAVLLVYEARGLGGAVVSGIALGIAVLCRLDFVLIAPAIGLFRLWYIRRALDFALMVIAGLLTLAAGWAIGIVPVDEILAIYDFARTEIIEKADFPGWDSRSKLFIMTVVLSPLGWLFLVPAGIWVLRQPKYRLAVLLGLIALAPLFLSARNMLTPKYMIPAYALAPVLAAIIWVRVTEALPQARQRLAQGLWVLATVFLLFVSVEPRPRAPFVTLTMWDAFRINTHDGPRTWGAVLLNMLDVLPDPDGRNGDARQAQADQFFEMLMQPGSRDIVAVGHENYFMSGGVVWRDVQVRLEHAGFKGALIGPEAIRFDVPAGRFTMRTDRPARDGVTCLVPMETDETAQRSPASWVEQNC